MQIILLLNLANIHFKHLIEIMRINNVPSWRSVTYQHQMAKVPEERWGHSFTKVSQNQIAMFGGYGGSSQDGKYLDDLWTYDTVNSEWQKVTTTGEHPEARSNYTLHFNDRKQELILFGGGTDKKVRFNDVCILDWQTKIWRRIMPKENQPSPWERTYHTSEFIYPYLVIFGGQSLSCLDLDDMWAFNIQSGQWKELQFNLQGQEVAYPLARRFHSSAFLNNCFFVIGGCKDSNYVLLGDIYKVDLTRLLENGESSNFQWQLTINNNKQLQRWGHSSNVYDDKIFISCGRISSSQDSNETFVYEPLSNTFKVYPTSQQGRPKARRRHSSLIIGNCLLLFGGYNGKYLQQFDYLPLKATEQEDSQSYQLLFKESPEEVQKYLHNIQKKQKTDIILKVIQNGKTLMKVKSNLIRIRSNPYFRCLLAHNSQLKTVSVHLPAFCDLISFRTVLSAITNGIIPISQHNDIQYCSTLLKTAQYFCSFDIIPTIEVFLLQKLDNENCLHLYQLAFELSMPKLKQYSAEMYLNSGKSSLFNVQSDHSKRLLIFSQTVENEAKNQFQSRQYLQQLYTNMRFNIVQTKLRNQKDNLFFKAASKIKDIFSRTTTQPSSQTSTANPSIQTKKESYLTRFVDFVSSICKKTKVQPQLDD